MPLPHFHSCRIREPNTFESGSFRTLHTKTKGLTFISGKLKETGKSAVQSFRYDKKIWVKSRAASHCGSHNGSFEAAISKTEIINFKKQGVDFDIRNEKVNELVEDAFCLKAIWNILKLDNNFEDWTKEEVSKYHKKVIDVLKKKGYPLLVKKSLTPSDIPELLKPGGNPAFQSPKVPGFIYKLCMIEQKEKGKSEDEAKKICEILKKTELELEDKNEKIQKEIQKHDYYLDVPKGSMNFVYQHHWSNLTEEEANTEYEKDMNESKILEGVLRLSIDSHLIGYTVLLGEAKDNIEKDALVSLSNKEKLRVGLKLLQPKKWLKAEGAYAPEEITFNSNEWSNFFIIDKGKYKQGVKREHFQEYFLEGEKLNGRYIFIYAPVSKIQKTIPDADMNEIFLEDTQNTDTRERVWLVQKPKDQRPYAETHKLNVVIAELKDKNQEWLVWSSPNIKLQKINVTEYELETKDIELN